MIIDLPHRIIVINKNTTINCHSKKQSTGNAEYWINSRTSKQTKKIMQKLRKFKQSMDFLKIIMYNTGSINNTNGRY